MPAATIDLLSKRIKEPFAQSDIAYTRRERLFFLGNYSLVADEGDQYEYTFDGNHGTYAVNISLKTGEIAASCSAPFPIRDASMRSRSFSTSKRGETGLPSNPRPRRAPKRST